MVPTQQTKCWESGPRVAPFNAEVEYNMPCDRETIDNTVPKAECGAYSKIAFNGNNNDIHHNVLVERKTDHEPLLDVLWNNLVEPRLVQKPPIVLGTLLPRTYPCVSLMGRTVEAQG